MICRRVFLVGVFVLAGLGYAYADDFFVDEYEFEWKVFTEGDLTMYVVQTEETSYIKLWNQDFLGGSLLRLTPIEAVKIATVLSQTREYFNQQKGAESDISEDVQAGEYEVVFRTSVKYGFSVTVRNPSSFGLDSFSLKRNQAIKLAPELKQAPEMIEYLDGVLSFE